MEQAVPDDLRIRLGMVVEVGDENHGTVETHGTDVSIFLRVHMLLHSLKKWQRYRYRMPIADYGRKIRRYWEYYCDLRYHLLEAQMQNMNRDHSPYQGCMTVFYTRHDKLVGM